MSQYDTLIIGGGPSGLYAAFYSGLRGMNVKLIEHHDVLGGKLNIYPEKIIWDVGGVPASAAETIRNNMILQAKTFHPDISLNTTCERIIKQDNYFKIYCNRDVVYETKSVIIATGLGIFTPRKLDIEGAEKYEVTNLHYTVKSFAQFKHKHIIISGAGDTGLDWADALSHHATHITIVCRGDEVRGHEQVAEQVASQPNVDVVKNTQITRLIANDGHHISEVQLSNGSRIHVDDVIISHGYESNAAFLDCLAEQFSFNKYGMIKTTNKVETPIPGIYACGDQVTYNNKVRLIAGAFSEAAQAANSAKSFIDADAPKEGLVSSHNDIFKARNKEIIKQL